MPVRPEKSVVFQYAVIRALPTLSSLMISGVEDPEELEILPLRFPRAPPGFPVIWTRTKHMTHSLGLKLSQNRRNTRISVHFIITGRIHPLYTTQATARNAIDPEDSVGTPKTVAKPHVFPIIE
jgi:hypothetical protein